MKRSKRIEALDARPVNRDGFIDEWPEMGFVAIRDAEFQMGKYGGAKAGLSWLREWSAVRWPTECGASSIAACCVGSCSVLRFSPWKGGCGQVGRRGGSPYTMADPLQASPAPA